MVSIWLWKWIHIKEIPQTITKLENSKIFWVLIKQFNNYIKKNPQKFQEFKKIFWKNEKEDFSYEEIAWNNMLLRAFEDFINELVITGKINIQETEINKYKQLKQDFEKRYLYVLSWSSIVDYYDEIVVNLYSNLWKSKADPEVKKEMLAFNAAYAIAKQWIHRLLREKKIEKTTALISIQHLKETMEIIVRELFYPNLNKIILALFHNSKENFDLHLEDIKKIFWEKIEQWINILSELEKNEFTKDWRSKFVIKYEIHWIEWLYQQVIKELQKLWCEDKDIIDVKVAEVINHSRILNRIKSAKTVESPSFNFKFPKIIWKIKIREILQETENLEDSKWFKELFKKFNEFVRLNHETFIRLKNMFYKSDLDNFEFSEIISSNILLRYFENFIHDLAIMWKLVIEKDSLPKYLELKQDFEKRYQYILAWSNNIKYYDEIVSRIYIPMWKSKIDQDVISDMQLFNSAYHLMKYAFANKTRKQKLTNEEAIRYFEHLKWTMEIVLREIPNPNIKKVIIALLHDSKEDLWLTLIDISTLFGEDIAHWVEHLSKLNIEEFMDIWMISDIQELERTGLIKGFLTELKDIKTQSKALRNFHYFWHMQYIQDDDILDVKFADRIHNLRTLYWLPEKEITQKIQETERYFLDVARERNPVAYEIIVKELNKLRKYILETYWKQIPCTLPLSKEEKKYLIKNI